MLFYQIISKFISGRHYLKMQPNEKWSIAVFIEILKKFSAHYRAYLLSLTGSFTVALKADWAVQKDAQCELKLPSLNIIHWMPLVSLGLNETKINLLDRFSSRLQDRSKISKLTFKDLKTKLRQWTCIFLINWTTLFLLLGVNGVLLYFLLHFE